MTSFLYYKEDKVGVAVINIFPLCHSENALKRSKHQAMWI